MHIDAHLAGQYFKKITLKNANTSYPVLAIEYEKGKNIEKISWYDIQHIMNN